MERENRETESPPEEQTSFRFDVNGGAAGEPAESGVAGQADVPDPSLPAGDDWRFRPDSPSERYTDPRTEISFARAMTEAPANYPAVIGLVLALLGIVPGNAGLVLAIGGIAVSLVGLVAAARGAKRRAWAFTGAILGAVLAAAHWLLPY